MNRSPPSITFLDGCVDSQLSVSIVKRLLGNEDVRKRWGICTIDLL